MRTLVTGAAGFVGANLVRHLARAGHEVHATCRPGGDPWRLRNLGAIAMHDVELSAPGAAAGLVSEVSPQWIFHLAAHGAYSWQTDAQTICNANLQATIALADAAERRGVRAFIHAGSSSEYGFKDHPPREDERPDPNSAYAVTKAAATMYCRHRAREGSLPATTLRLYSVYGALEDPRRLVCTLLRDGLQRCLPALVSPDTARDFVYIEDACDAFVLAAERAEDTAGEIYNVGSGRQTTLRKLVECVRTLLDIPDEPHWGTHPQRSWDTDLWCADVAQIARDLGWVARTEIGDGLRRTATWMTASVRSQPPELYPQNALSSRATPTGSS